MSHRYRILALTAAATALIPLAACGEADAKADAAGTTGLTVVATTPEVADFARAVGGDHITLTQLIKVGVDPHEYEPTPADIKAISDAELVVENGVGLEEWLAPTISSAGFRGPVVDSSRGVALRPDDPHIWHNPQNARLMVGNIEKGLAAADPAHAADYAKNSAAYTAEIDELDRENQAAFDALPAADRKLVTDHDAFGYYVDRYRLQFVGSVIPSMDTSAELSAQQLTDLVAKIEATGVKAIFTESSLPPKTAEAIAEQAGVRVIGGEDALFGDSLGAPGTPEGSYLGAERHNTQVITAALAGR
ncbi:zinc/manganese transport system substrate-binding protein [Actinoplanes octamycinicus]|uniref:Zinc/manganese transport system substrate-binding protein n=1 Tax=Actinoplanes octamycinicus TaxID=135948 RepID=A0A7W7MCE2_9ACTN|nr:metal ABC transporter substrate-binding protein [Actinoplanes octamycinicus]MBB4745021.1 zinc/manganese transport system substrate-binding protein [Actinoplanes octamycinicus]GIE55608.1 adhesin B [Actinoplanes octamycinicus]